MKIRYLVLTAVLATAILFSANIAKASCMDENFSQKTTAEKIQCLVAVIAELNQQITQLQAQQGGGTTWCHTFNTNLRYGDQNSEVSALQTALGKEAITIEDYSARNDGTFTEGTASAVVAFQEKYASEILTPLGLTHGTGYVASATRAKLNALYGCAPTPICSNLYWFDNTNDKPCQAQKQFCGVFMYYGLRTFNNQQDCLNAFNIARGNCTPNWQCIWQPCRADGTQVLREQDLNNCGGPMTTMVCPPPSYRACTPSTQPSITVLSPNGGEVWKKGTTQTIKWKSINLSSNATVNIKLRKGQDTYPGSESEITGVTGATIQNTDSFQWAIPTTLPDGNDYSVRIISAFGGDGPYASQAVVSDESDNYFSIVAATTTAFCTDSDGGLNYYTKGTLTTNAAQWTSPSYDSCQTNIQGGQYQDTVSCAGDNCYIHEYSCNWSTPINNAPLKCPNGCENGACKPSIQPSITSISPNPAAVGSTVTVIGANLSGFEGDKNLWIENSAGQKGIVYGASGSTDTMIKFTLAGSYCTADTSYSGLPCPSSITITPGTYNIYALPWGTMSNKVLLSIVAPTPTITVLSPSGGTWVLGKTYNITWSSSDLDKVSILFLYSLSGLGFNYITIAADVPASQGTYSWTIPTTGGIVAGTNYYIWVGKYKPPAQSGSWDLLSAAANSETYGISNPFGIGSVETPSSSSSSSSSSAVLPSAINNVSFLGSSQAQLGKTVVIKWESKGLDKVSILLLQKIKLNLSGSDYVIYYKTIATDVPNNAIEISGWKTGTYSWTVPATTGIIIPNATYYIWVGEYKPTAQSGFWDQSAVNSLSSLLLSPTANLKTYGVSGIFNIISATSTSTSISTPTSIR